MLLLLFVEYICYDDGCHLKKFAENPVRCNITATAQKIASLKIMVDKMHILGHTDKWCLEHCDSRKEELKMVSIFIG